MRAKLEAWVRRRGFWWLLVPGLMGAGVAAFAAQHDFPFNRTLLLDVAPMHDSKRVPMLEVRSNGAAAIDLWCASGSGRVDLVGASIRIVPHGFEPATCAPQRRQRDARMLSALTRITTWRREGDSVVLIGPQVLRYTLSTN